MKKIPIISIRWPWALVCACFSLSTASALELDPNGLMAPEGSNVRVLSIPKPPASIAILHNGKQAVIDWSGDRVTYSGDLPVDESARMLFEHVGRLARACRDK